jgi:mRNA capping enzyme, C-terminal domain
MGNVRLFPWLCESVMYLCSERPVAARWKRSGEQIDDRVIEVVWNPSLQTWCFLRFRDDKHEGNFHTVVRSILDSIRDGVEQEAVSVLFSTDCRSDSLLWSAVLDGVDVPGLPAGGQSRVDQKCLEGEGARPTLEGQEAAAATTATRRGSSTFLNSTVATISAFGLGVSALE